MSRAITAAGSAGFRDLVAEVLSTLPRTFAPLGGAAPGVAVVIDGARDWVAEARAARDAGAGGILVLEPQPVNRDALTAFVSETRTSDLPVRLARQWAGDPAVTALAAQPRSAGETTLIDSEARLAPGARLDHLLVAQIDLVQAAAGGSVRLESLTRNAHGYAASGRLLRGEEAHLLLLTGVLTTAHAPRARVRELLFAGRRAVSVADGRVARASDARIGDAEGDRILPTVNETAYRIGLRALANDLVTASGDRSDLDAYLAALDAASATEGIAR